MTVGWGHLILSFDCCDYLTKQKRFVLVLLCDNVVPGHDFSKRGHRLGRTCYTTSLACVVVNLRMCMWEGSCGIAVFNY